MGKVKYMTYEKFKKLYKIKKYCNDIQTNLRYNNIVLIDLYKRQYVSKTMKYTISPLKYVKQIAKIRNIKDGIVIYRIVLDEWELPWIRIYWADENKLTPLQNS